MIRPRHALLILLAAAAWVVLARDGRLHWDEPGYLYQGAYQSTAELLDAEFQPSGLPSFTLPRIAHLLFVKLVCAAVGPGQAAFDIISGVYLAMLLGSLALTYGILRTLMPGLREAAAGVAVGAFAPVVLYLGFKTLPESPAIFFTTLAVYALLRSLDAAKTRAAAWLLVVAASLCMVGLLKQTLALGFASFVPLLLAFYGDRFPRPRVIGCTLAAGVGSLVLFGAALVAMGLSLRAFLDSLAGVAGEKEPLASLVMNVGTEGGLLFLAAPLALLSTRRRHAWFMLAWFVLTTLPLLLITASIESRYLVQNVPPLCGLVALSLEGLRVRLANRPRLAAAGAALAAMLLLVTGELAQRVSPHEVETDDLHAMLAAIDAEVPDASVLVPWEYTDFHWLRFIDPQRPIYTVHARRKQTGGGADATWTAEAQRRWYGERFLTPDDALPTGPLVYLGFTQTMPIANLRELAGLVPLPSVRAKLDAELAKMSPRSQLHESWLWNDPRYRLDPMLELGHYRALRVVPAR